MTVTRDLVVQDIAHALWLHRRTLGEDGQSRCACGWWVLPLLDSVHRAHQAEEILGAVVLATAHVNAENITVATADLREELAECQSRLLSS